MILYCRNFLRRRHSAMLAAARFGETGQCHPNRNGVHINIIHNTNMRE